MCFYYFFTLSHDIKYSYLIEIIITYLFYPHMGLYQLQPHRVRVDMRVIVMKPILLQSFRTGDSTSDILYCHTQNAPFFWWRWVLPLYTRYSQYIISLADRADERKKKNSPTDIYIRLKIDLTSRASHGKANIS